MTDLSGSFESVGVSAVQGRSMMIEPAKSTLSFDELLCRWMLRLVLPLLVGLCGQLIFWMWFDDVYRAGAWSTVSGVLLTFVAAAMSFWAWQAWRSQDGF